MTESGYRKMTRLVSDLAASHAGGKVLSLLEGGYDLEALSSSVQVHLEELLSQPAPGPDSGPSPQGDTPDS